MLNFDSSKAQKGRRDSIARRIMVNEAVTQYGGHLVVKEARHESLKAQKSLKQAMEISQLYKNQIAEMDTNLEGKLLMMKVGESLRNKLAEIKNNRKIRTEEEKRERSM